MTYKFKALRTISLRIFTNVNKTECVKITLEKCSSFKYNQHNPVLQAFTCSVLILFESKRKNYYISNIIIIMSIIITTVQKDAQTPLINLYREHCTSQKQQHKIDK